jgi:transcriptional antiterminator NusG
MKYYVIQVKVREEEKYISRFREQYADIPVSLYFIRRELDVRKQGKTRRVDQPLFPGYLFLESADDDEDIRLCRMACRKVKGFVRFLFSDRHVSHLAGNDLSVTLHFIRAADENGKLELSAAYFDERERIVITAGPLLGLEGSIVKVDRRRRRVKVVFDLYEDSFSVDFGFEVVKKI